ncbi:MAG: VOC family protein [Oscillospiraceae bacterium]|jgi:catechol 2,3-dioxygenase-like lactoylglutathione lyase family enzyme|nr:VOC family protein [Oscillospiraceae bacterium]
MSVIGTQKITQVALIVSDIGKTKQKLAQFFGIEAPPTSDGGDFAVTQTQYMGQPAPKAQCQMAFFNVGDGVQLELIQPNEEPSVWRDFLNEKGEGIHHIAFGVKGMDDQIKACEGFGMKLVQKGNYGSGNGCYSYLEAGDGLPLLVELLESF